MIRKVADWFDHRVGYRDLLKGMLYEQIPGGPRWRYVWGTTFVFTFVVQLITGFFLWMFYSASSQTAWESVYFIQHRMEGGWLLRGIHHYAAQAIVILLALHLLQMVIFRAYLAPREVKFWLFLLLIPVLVGFSTTGWLLPYDQQGLWGSRVPMNISGLVPFVGPQLQRLLVGESGIGHHTLTHFLSLHTGFLPLLTIGILCLIGRQRRRHGYPSESRQSAAAAHWWPDQMLRDGVVCLAVLTTIMFIAWNRPAHLGAPADPSQPYAAARPEWHFLFLFQFLKLFPGNIALGAIHIPGAMMTLIALMPFIGKWNLGHRFNVMFILVVFAGAIGLTGWAMYEDSNKIAHQKAIEVARKEGQRVVELVEGRGGVPVAGAVTLLRDDPLTQGPRLFAQRCSSCHRYDGRDGLGNIIAEQPTAPDLARIGTKSWLTDFLDPKKIKSHEFFGGTKFVKKNGGKDSSMVKFVLEDVADLLAYPEDKAALETVIVALAAESGLDVDLDEKTIEEGRTILKENDVVTCLDCHKFHGEGGKKGPDLSGWGSRKWLYEMIDDPTADKHYGKDNDRMPAFGASEQLTPKQIGMLVDWLRGDWFEPGDEWIEDRSMRFDFSAVAETPQVKVEVKPEPAKPDPKPGPPKPDPTPSPVAAVDFVKHIKPIFEASCVKCHGGNPTKKPKGKYNITTKDGAFKDENVVPGKPAESFMIDQITAADPDERMPPEDEVPALTKGQIALIRKWIESGAPWPDDIRLKLPELPK